MLLLAASILLMASNPAAPGSSKQESYQEKGEKTVDYHSEDEIVYGDEEIDCDLEDELAYDEEDTLDVQEIVFEDDGEMETDSDSDQND